MSGPLVGQAITRLEDAALLTGRGRFVDDMHLPGMAHAAFVRSDEAHARITGIDTTAATALDGVVAVLALADLPARFHDQRMPPMPNPHVKQNVMPYVLAKDEVCHVGDPIAIVIAEDRYVAEDAAALVMVDYEPLPVVGDCRAALEPGAPVAHAGAPDNLGARLEFAYGDVAGAFSRAAHVVTESLFMHRGLGHPIEGRAALASYDEIEEKLTLYTASQGPHAAMRALVAMLGWDEQRIRVMAPDVGGGFGPKMSFYAEQVATCLAALHVGRAVKWIEDRREHFVAANQERDQYWDMEMALDAEGRILGVRGRMIHDKGAYMPHGTILPHISCTTVPGPYVVPAYQIACDIVLTNKPPVAPVRGAGRPQAVFAMERLMDGAARATGLDRAEIRRRNTIPAEKMPYPVGLTFRDGRPLTYDSGDYPQCLEKALAAAGYDAFAARQAQARAEGRYIGIGIASVVEGTGLGPFEGATVRIGASGKVTLITGAAAQGQGHVTTFAQVCAEQFGVAPGDVRVVTADTAAIANGTGTFASRQAVNAGNSTHLAAIAVRDKVLKIAAHMLEAAADDLELANGEVFVKGVPDMKVTLSAVARAVTGQSGYALPEGIEPGLEATRYFSPEQAAYANGTHVAEVEVDPETGGVRVTGYWIAHDCGTVINPLVVEGQVQGGLAHGIGNALLEWMHYDGAGQPQTITLADYLMPIADAVPKAQVSHVVSPSPLNPLGVKGAGEGGTIPAPAAIVSAVEHALEPFGVRLTQAPVPPHYLVGLIQAQQG